MLNASQSTSFASNDNAEGAAASPPSETRSREAEPTSRPLRVEVIFATRGRASILSGIVKALAGQTLAPDAVTVSCASPADAEDVIRHGGVKLLLGPAGLARQRNLALHHLAPDTDIVVFFDDDFMAHPNWLEEVERCFRHSPDIAAITGHVLADGIKGPGISLAEAVALLAAPDIRRGLGIRENYSPYGCNMAFRRSAIQGLSFDERLVLYGWLEDRDYGGALAQRGGRLVKLEAAMGVHLGTKAGRLSGRRLGYSQIVNPVYLRTKGTITRASLLQHWFKNIVSNVVLSLRPEPYVDRRGRLHGNILGFRDLLLGGARPERAEWL